MLVTMLVAICFSSCAHQHEWGEWENISNSTCTIEGLQQRTCKCGEKDTKSIETIEHSFDEWIITNDATCIADGLRKRKCVNCDYEETDIINAVGYHSFGDWKITRPNCMQDGTKERECTVCNDKESKTLNNRNYHRYNDYICLDCNEHSLLNFTLPSVPLKISNSGLYYGEYIIECYNIYSIKAAVISWNEDGTCTVEIAISGEKTYESKEAWAMRDEISIRINSGDVQIDKTIYVGPDPFVDKSITLVLQADCIYEISIRDGLYV